MKFIQVIDSVLTRVVNIALVALFIVMLSLAVVQLGLRYFLNNSILWGDIAARTLVIWVGILGAVLATRDNKHFHIDVLTRFLKIHHQLWFQRFSNLFAAVICFFLGQASVTFVELDLQSKAFLDIPMFVIALIIPIGFYLMMIQFLLRMLIPDAVPLDHGPLQEPTGK
jgi:TRAP-type C4-dicarboxylate transport system permease small subunit